jgi:hypothetical protein
MGEDYIMKSFIIYTLHQYYLSGQIRADEMGWTFRFLCAS